MKNHYDIEGSPHVVSPHARTDFPAFPHCVVKRGGRVFHADGLSGFDQNMLGKLDRVNPKLGPM